MSEQTENIFDQFLYDTQFEVIKMFSKGIVRRHKLVDINKQDYEYIKQIAFEKATPGARVDIMPILSEYDPLRKTIFPDAYFAKNPDLRIDDILFEIEQPTKIKLNTLKHCIDSAAKQADNVIVNLPQSIDENFMLRIVKGRFKDHKNLKTIEFRFEGKYYPFKK